jgi:hypothetical protein
MQGVAQALVMFLSESLAGPWALWALAVIVAAAGFVLSVRAVRRRLARSPRPSGPRCPQCSTPHDAGKSSCDSCGQRLTQAPLVVASQYPVYCGYCGECEYCNYGQQ